jgi:recombination protein RecT
VAILSSPDIYNLFCANPHHALGQLAKCAMDGLLPDGRQAAIVPFKGKPMYIPMADGMRLRAEANNDISHIDEPKLVYKADKFEYESGDNERLLHVPDVFLDDRGALLGGYCIAHLTNGGIRRCVMTVAEINKRRDASASKNGPWRHWYEEMAKKTILKKMCKTIPSSVDLSSLFNREDENMADITPNEFTGQEKPVQGEVIEQEVVELNIEVIDGDGEVTAFNDPDKAAAFLQERYDEAPEEMKAGILESNPGFAEGVEIMRAK